MSQSDLISVIKGAGIAAVGAVLTYLSQSASGSDFGSASVFVAAVVSVLANVLRKYVSPTT